MDFICVIDILCVVSTSKEACIPLQYNVASGHSDLLDYQRNIINQLFALPEVYSLFQKKKIGDTVHLGTFKVLSEDHADYKIMVQLTSIDPYRLNIAAWHLITPVSDVNGNDVAKRSCNDEIMQETERLKHNFLTSVSHELKTPLNGILANVDLLLQSELNSDQETLARGIEHGSHMLLGLINDLIDYSKLRSGAMTVESYPFSISKCVQAVMDQYKTQSNEKEITFTHEIDPSVVKTCISDAVKLKRILQHIVGNALKYTQSGHVYLSVRNGAETEAASDIQIVQFIVEDTGSGVPEDTLKRLNAFSPGQQGHRRAHDGLGLGLALSEQLAILLGGKLTIESRINNGTKVYLNLPLKKSAFEVQTDMAVRSPRIFSNDYQLGVSQKTSDSNNNEPATHPEITPTDAPKNSSDIVVEPAQQRISVLLVEDNKINNLIIEKMLLRLLGSKPDIAWNGLEALEAVNKKVYDLIFMDLAMPVMDGFEATRQIRERLPTFYTQPPYICALTANTSNNEREDCFKAGMNAFVSKPVQSMDLKQSVDVVVKNRKKSPTATQSASGFEYFVLPLNDPEK